MAEKQNFLKENFALIVGISLPVLLVLLFSLATVVPRYFVDPPKYNLIFSINSPDYSRNPRLNGQLLINVENKKLRARFLVNKKKEATYFNLTHLYLFEAATGNIHEIPINLPPSNINSDRELPIPETENFTIETNTIAPDGYEYRAPSYESGGLMGELIVGGRHSRTPSIAKGSYTIKIPPTGQGSYYSYGYDLHFIGWVIPGEKK